MASTAEQVRRLARTLTDASGVNVTAEYDAPRRRDGSRNGWSLSWSAGPTREQMRRLAVHHLSSKPAEAPLETIAWWRSLGTDEQAAAAVLAWMAEHPDDAAHALVVDDDALPGSPDQLPVAVRRRAATLAAAGWRPYTASATARELAAHAQRGWPAVAAWLDDLGEHQDATVIAFPGA